MSITMASADNHTGLPPPRPPVPPMGNDAQPPGHGSPTIITRHFSSPGRLRPIESLPPPSCIQLDVTSQRSTISSLGMFVVCHPLSSFPLVVRRSISCALIIRCLRRPPLSSPALAVLVHHHHRRPPPPSSAAGAIIATLLSPPSLATRSCPSPS